MPFISVFKAFIISFEKNVSVKFKFLLNFESIFKGCISKFLCRHTNYLKCLINFVNRCRAELAQLLWELALATVTLALKVSLFEEAVVDYVHKDKYKLLVRQLNNLFKMFKKPQHQRLLNNKDLLDVRKRIIAAYAGVAAAVARKFVFYLFLTSVLSIFSESQYEGVHAE